MAEGGDVERVSWIDLLFIWWVSSEHIWFSACSQNWYENLWKQVGSSCANIYTYSVTKKVSKYCLGPARERLFKPYLITPPHFLSTDQTAKFNTSRMYVVKLDSFWTDKIGMDWRYKKSVVVAIKRDIRRSGYQTCICYAFVSKLFIL